ncbi:hypothetical protein ACJ2A9_23150 [Anaerobacillus sp. MEB173]|uniref:hypothetical protein n=1 Tax=Anaerobacillus sp. MEB173 TaxID=3383345 RepID=UPI003F918406
MRNLVIGGVLILGLFLVIQFFGFTNSIIFSAIEWSTKFILPWVFLYWLIRTVKALEKK